MFRQEHRTWQIATLALASTSPVRRIARFQRRFRSYQRDSNIARVPNVERDPLLVWFDEYCPIDRLDAGSMRSSYILSDILGRGISVIFITADSRCSSHDHPHGMIIFQPNWVAFGIKKLAQKANPAAIWISRTSVADDYLALITRVFGSTPVIFDTVDLQSRRLELEATRLTSRLVGRLASRWKANEQLIARAAERVIAVTDIEKDLLKPNCKALPLVIPTVHPGVKNSAELGQRSGAVFVANFRHDPNVVALGWLLREVWPLVASRNPEMQLCVVGSNPPRHLVESAGSTVTFEGRIEDLETYLNQRRVNVAPLITGAGVKGKITEALSLGLPTITTSVGADGIPLVHMGNSLVADNAADFARQIELLNSDDLLWQKLSQAGYALFEERYSLEVLKDAVDSLLKDLKLESR